MKTTALIIMMGVLLSTATPAFADVTVKDAWVRATPGAAKVTAGYVTILNTGSSDDSLIGVRASGAGMAHVHSSGDKDGVMRMDSVPALTIPAGKELALVPGGYHIMIMDLKTPLKVGDEFPLTLTFKNRGDVSVIAKVMPLAYGGNDKPPASQDHHK